MRYVILLAMLVGPGCGSSDLIMVNGEFELRVEPPELIDRVSIPPEEARDIALAEVGGGTVEEAELEEENDRIVYSFEIRTTDGRLVEVELDAMTGEVLEVEDEDDDDDDDDEDPAAG